MLTDRSLENYTLRSSKVETIDSLCSGELTSEYAPNMIVSTDTFNF